MVFSMGLGCSMQYPLREKWHSFPCMLVFLNLITLTTQATPTTHASQTFPSAFDSKWLGSAACAKRLNNDNNNNPPHSARSDRRFRLWFKFCPSPCPNQDQFWSYGPRAFRRAAPGTGWLAPSFVFFFWTIFGKRFFSIFVDFWSPWGIPKSMKNQ